MTSDASMTPSPRRSLDAAEIPGVPPADAPEPAPAYVDTGVVLPPDGARRRLGVMGGTFDPIHHGHLVAASEVAARFHLDEVVFVPTGNPWQKAGKRVSQAEDRYLMTVIATASNPRFSVSRVDIERPGYTYTVDTLKDIRRERGDDVDLFFITGADALAKILTWRGADELFDLAQFVGVSRPGVPLGEDDIAHLPHDRVTLLEVPAMAISSTACRERVARKDPIWYLVPDGIVQYIAKRGLYAPVDDGQAQAPDPTPGVTPKPVTGVPDAPQTSPSTTSSTREETTA